MAKIKLDKKVDKDKPLVPNWTPRNATLVGIIALIAVAGGGYLGVVSPVLAANAEQRDMLISAEEGFEIAKQNLLVAEGFQKRYPIAKEQYERVIADFPGTAEISELNLQIDNVARQAGVNVSSITSSSLTTMTPPVSAAPQAAEPVEGEEPQAAEEFGGSQPQQVALPKVAQSDIAITATGSQANLIKFASLIKDLDRSLIISSTSIGAAAGADGDAGTYSLSITATTYFHAPIEDPNAVAEVNEVNEVNEGDVGAEQQEGTNE